MLLLYACVIKSAHTTCTIIHRQSNKVLSQYMLDYVSGDNPL